MYIFLSSLFLMTDLFNDLFFTLTGGKKTAAKPYDPKSIEKFKLIDKMADDDVMLFKDDSVPAHKNQKSNKKSAPSKPKTLKDAVNKVN